MADRIEALIGRLAPDPICDDCIGERLEISDTQDVRQRTHELAGTRGYERKTSPCTLCGTAKLTIRRARK
ncbi:MAG TPA: hypothetical protein VF503_13230 [Sphingobium sp.]|uniref:hypothetical protein n=1 Tax=Sphingobium sp. TaxID=1912891 RepID=UPI002ED586BA